MAEMAKTTTKKPEIKPLPPVLASKANHTFAAGSYSPSLYPVLSLHQSMGNQALQRMYRSGILQAKLKISQPGDIYEQEADRVADQVMRMPEHSLQGKENQMQINQNLLLNNNITPIVRKPIQSITDQAGISILYRKKNDLSAKKPALNEEELRRLAAIPGDAIKKWKRLSIFDQDRVVEHMKSFYGARFANDFVKYAKEYKGKYLVVEYSNLPSITPKKLEQRGYRLYRTLKYNFGDILKWVHPSGAEFWWAIRIKEPSEKLLEEKQKPDCLKEFGKKMGECEEISKTGNANTIHQCLAEAMTSNELCENSDEQEADLVEPMPEPNLQGDNQPQIHRKMNQIPLDLETSVSDDFLHNLGPGRVLDNQSRGFFEPRFGYDFSGVQVHVDEAGIDAARVVNAKAFTVGHDIVFGAQEYKPGTTEGKKLLTHELTHVVQQSGTLTRNKVNHSIQRQPAVAFTGITWSGLSPSAKIVLEQSFEGRQNNKLEWIWSKGVDARDCFNQMEPERRNAFQDVYKALEHVGIWRYVTRVIEIHSEKTKGITAVTSEGLVKRLVLDPNFCISGREESDWRQVVPLGTTASLHLGIYRNGQKMTAHIDTRAIVVGREPNGQCRYSLPHILPHLSRDLWGLPIEIVPLRGESDRGRYRPE